MTTTDPRGYAVRVTCAGSATLDLGQTPSFDEAVDIAGQWRAHPVTDSAEVVVLAPHPRANPSKHTLYTGDVYAPLVCRVDGCAWVGSHLGSHLRKAHDMGPDWYRLRHDYDGPMIVGPAVEATAKAHEAKRRAEVRVGMLVADEERLWEVTATDRGASTVTVEADGWTGGEAKTVTLDEFFAKYRPVGQWSARLMRDTRREWARADKVRTYASLDEVRADHAAGVVSDATLAHAVQAFEDSP